MLELCDKNKWQELARELGFRRTFIQDTKKKNSEGDSHCFAAVFVAWKKRARPKFTWGSLINALISINEPELAETLGEKIISPILCMFLTTSIYYMILYISADDHLIKDKPLGK